MEEVAPCLMEGCASVSPRKLRVCLSKLRGVQCGPRDCVTISPDIVQYIHLALCAACLRCWLMFVALRVDVLQSCSMEDASSAYHATPIRRYGIDANELHSTLGQRVALTLDIRTDFEIHYFISLETITTQDSIRQQKAACRSGAKNQFGRDFEAWLRLPAVCIARQSGVCNVLIWQQAESVGCSFQGRLTYLYLRYAVNLLTRLFSRYYFADEPRKVTHACCIIKPLNYLLNYLHSAGNFCVQVVVVVVYLTFMCMSEIARRGQPSGCTGSEAALGFVEAQIEYCVSTHDLCGKREPKSMPTRVLEILGPQHVHLMQTNGEFALYAALSHCWGNNVALQTTSENLGSHIDEIAWDSLPKTFQDAIDFSRRLGLKYIWIDSLCIVQDVRSDWHRESAKMRDIYRNAHVTLAATASPDGNGGCYRTKPPGKETKCRSYGGSLIDNQLHKGTRPLLRRAWALQERLLSARVIHFMDDEIAWECRRSETCECRVDAARSAGRMDARRNPHSASLRHLMHSAPFKQVFAATSTFSNAGASLGAWFLIVERYSSLSLSYPTDKLPALSGVARWMDNIKFGDYHAGLWGEHMSQCLCWYTPWPLGPRLANSSPSWSWSSIGSRVAHVRNDGIQNTKLWITPSSITQGPDRFSAVLGGQLHVEAELFKVSTTLHHTSKSDDQYYYNTGVPLLGIAFGAKTLKCYWDDDICRTWSETRASPWPQLQDPASSLPLYCFTICSGYYQISMVLFCEDWDMKVFRRVGLVERITYAQTELNFGQTELKLEVEEIWVTEKSVDNGKTSFTIK
jgi:hypothetical protein